MDINKMMFPMMSGIIGIIMVVMIIQTLTPQKNYICPICGEAFYTQAELEQHFTTAHPSEPIEIIWG